MENITISQYLITQYTKEMFKKIGYYKNIDKFEIIGLKKRRILMGWTAFNDLDNQCVLSILTYGSETRET